MEPIPVEVSQTQRQQSMPYDVSTKSFTQVDSISSYSPFVLPSNFQEMGIQVSDPDIVTNETCGSASQRGLSEDEIQTYLASMPKKEYSTTITLDRILFFLIVTPRLSSLGILRELWIYESFAA